MRRGKCTGVARITYPNTSTDTYPTSAAQQTCFYRNQL